MNPLDICWLYLQKLEDDPALSATKSKRSSRDDIFGLEILSCLWLETKKFAAPGIRLALCDMCLADISPYRSEVD
jgi:hypothetical protein